MELGKEEKEKVKVAYLLNIFPKISETFVLNEMLTMKEKGVEIQVFAYKDEKESRVHPRAKEVPVSYFYKAPFWKAIGAHFYWMRRSLKRYWRAWGFVAAQGDGIRKLFLVDLMDTVLVDQARPDQLHAHFGDEASNTALLIHLLSGVPFTFTTHSYDIFERRYDNWKAKSHLAKKHITISEYNKDYIVDRLDVEASDVEIIHCGIDFEKIPTASQSREDGFLFTAARLHTEKGLDILFRACRLLKNQGIRFRCEIAGEGSERIELEKWIHKLELKEDVILLGNQTQEEVFLKLSRACVYVLPSRSEGIPVSLMEAMAFRVPVIATRICGIPELIEDGKSGFLVPSENVEALADAIRRLLADSALRQAFAEQGYRKVSEDFDLRKETEKLLKLWEAP